MRINIGKNFSLFNQSGEWEAKVDNVNKGIIEFTIIKKLRSSYNEKEIWLAFAPIKLNYLNLMIQKATEIGVTRFIPILTERTIVRKLNEKRINKIIIEASEQSNRLKVPSLDKLTKLDTFLKTNQNANIIFGDLNTDNKKIDLKNKDPLCILIGPEGDFSIKERDNILKLKNILPLKINNNILRSETAAISMISIIRFNLLS
tara:strand:- start:120 stop:728 length:609 start_codon:yes stop_codon:yes gene_type:complete